MGGWNHQFSFVSEIHIYTFRWLIALYRFPVIKPALRLLKSYMPVLSIRLSLLMHFTLSALRSLSHDDGTPLVLIHSPSTQYTPSKHGAIISLSVVSSTGKFVPPRVVERRASLENIHIRAGCMCNPGAASELLGLTDVLAAFNFRKASYASDITSNNPNTSPLCTHSASQSESILAPTLCQDIEERDGPAATLSTYAANEDMERLIEEEGVVRVSFGLASSLEDSWAFISFVRSFRDRMGPLATEKVPSVVGRLKYFPGDVKAAGRLEGSCLRELWRKAKAQLRFITRIYSDCGP
jgi:hypothetical protein